MRILLACLIPGALLFQASARDDYEIQVYAAETVAAGRTMVELHSNFTPQGERDQVNGVLPSHHALHETVEITQGFTSWFETGFYVFTSVQPYNGWRWAGDHIRPRVRIPEEWHWPLGLSLSTEIGYLGRSFSEDTWSWELRPIIDKEWGRWYFALNPALEKSLSGLNSSAGFAFAPSAKVGFKVSELINVGVEYYASVGDLLHFDKWNAQQHQIFPVVDLDLGADWEFNFGVGFGLTKSTDELVVKMILGHRF